jgi:hypothetical protein
MTDKAQRREQQRRKARYSRTTSRAFLHTLDRLSAERDRKLRRQTPA